MKKFICIVGKKRSGKDTAAEFIKSMDENKGFQQIALADPIKNAIAHAYKVHKLHEESGMYVNRQTLDGESGTVDLRAEPLLLSNKQVADLMSYAVSWTGAAVSEETIKTVIMKNNKPWSLRRLMQLLGTDLVGTHCDSYFWVRKLIDATMVKSEVETTYIVSDVRLQKELDFFRSIGAIIIFIDRDTGIEDTHITEQGLQPGPDDIVINNNGTLEEFYEQLRKVNYGNH